MKKSLLLVCATILLLAMSGISLGNTGAAPEEVLPYIGVIQNKTDHDISIPSLNSSATLIVPARGWIEFTAWAPNFELIGYLNGKPLCCQNIQVNPDSYQFMCKAYDFNAEICPREEPVRKYKPIRKKKRPFKKKKKSVEVEGLG
jgi:hypothetical protein